MMAVTPLTALSVCVVFWCSGNASQGRDFFFFFFFKPRLMRLDAGEGRNENMTLDGCSCGFNTGGTDVH